MVLGLEELPVGFDFGAVHRDGDILLLGDGSHLFIQAVRNSEYRQYLVTISIGGMMDGILTLQETSLQTKLESYHLLSYPTSPTY